MKQIPKPQKSHKPSERNFHNFKLRAENSHIPTAGILQYYMQPIMEERESVRRERSNPETMLTSALQATASVQTLF